MSTSTPRVLTPTPVASRVTTTPPSATQLYRIADAMVVLSLSRTVIFELLRSGRLRSVKQGRTRLIPASAIHEYIALLEKEAGRPE
jgi:excisionase family DNA binding protein